MAAIKTYEANEYLSEWIDYVTDLFVKWLGIMEIKEQETKLILEAIQNNIQANYRVSYLKFLLPYVSKKHLQYYLENEAAALAAAQKIIYSMLINDIRYNDYNVNSFLETMLAFVGEERPSLADPIHPDFMDIQKLLWTFIVHFKKKRNLPIVSDGRIELY
jgi:hypothetical protein